MLARSARLRITAPCTLHRPVALPQLRRDRSNCSRPSDGGGQLVAMPQHCRARSPLAYTAVCRCCLRLPLICLQWCVSARWIVCPLVLRSRMRHPSLSIRNQRMTLPMSCCHLQGQIVDRIRLTNCLASWELAVQDWHSEVAEGGFRDDAVCDSIQRQLSTNKFSAVFESHPCGTFSRRRQIPGGHPCLAPQRFRSIWLISHFSQAKGPHLRAQFCLQRDVLRRLVLLRQPAEWCFSETWQTYMATRQC